jgi:hypothetical protein
MMQNLAWLIKNSWGPKKKAKKKTLGSKPVRFWKSAGLFFGWITKVAILAKSAWVLARGNNIYRVILILCF